MHRHQVDYVVVGGYAATLHGAQRPTSDVDITPSTTTENLQRLAAALSELQARVRTATEPEGLPFAASAESLRGVVTLNLQTPIGELDLAFSPAGTEGYSDLTRSATTHQVASVQVRVAALGDVIRSKEAAGRPKDADALPELYRLAGVSAQTAPFPTSPASPAGQRPQPTPAERIAAARRAARREPPGRQTPDDARDESER